MVIVISKYMVACRGIGVSVKTAATFASCVSLLYGGTGSKASCSSLLQSSRNCRHVCDINYVRVHGIILFDIIKR